MASMKMISPSDRRSRHAGQPRPHTSQRPSHARCRLPARCHSPLKLLLQLALLFLFATPGAPAQGPAPSAGEPEPAPPSRSTDDKPATPATDRQPRSGRASLPPPQPPPPPPGTDPQAYRELAALAVDGDPEAQFQLGLVWLDAPEDVRRPGQALRWFRQAARQRYAPALFALGFMHESGDGVEADATRAASFYLRAADLGHPAAQDNYARCLTFGLGVEIDRAAAFTWYRRAAWQGSPSAQLGLGIAYLSGSGIDKDLATAFQWIEKSAAQDHTPALAELGIIYLSGEEVPRDFEAAISWLERAAANGDPWSANNLAWLYATCEEEAFLDAEKALANADIAIDLAEANYGEVPAEIADTVAAAHARAANWPEALRWQQSAIDSLNARLEAAQAEDGDEGQYKTNLEDFKVRLQLYRDEKPYVERPDVAPETTPRFRDI